MPFADSYGSPSLPPALPGFESIQRRWDEQLGCFAARVMPGEYYVTRGDEVIKTVLGSCVSACIRDRQAGVGGMNHFMLPLTETDSVRDASPFSVSAANRYGNYAMENLINAILKNGGRRENLEVKVFGGATLVNNSSAVGAGNVEFVVQYLQLENLRIVSQDLGGACPRRLVYFPMSGRTLLKRMESQDRRIVESDKHYLETIKGSSVKGEAELF